MPGMDGGRLELGSLRGSLRFCAADRALDVPADWEVRFRRGGERMAIGGRHKSVKQFFQEQGVVPWMRAHVPLLYRAGRLSAVGDLWQLDELATGVDPGAVRLRWENHPAVN